MIVKGTLSIPAQSTTDIAAARVAEAQVTAAQVAGEVGRRDLVELDRHRLLLSLVVADLSLAAGQRLSWDLEDPTPALVRALGRFASEVPDAVSDYGHQLLEALADA